MQKTISAGFRRFYGRSAAFILVITASAKLLSLLSMKPVLLAKDPLFDVPNWGVLCLASLLEISVVILLKARFYDNLSISGSSSLGAVFLIYRIALAMGGFSRGCPCMGTLTDAFHVDPQRVNSLLWGVATYLLLGGCYAIWSERPGESDRISKKEVSAS